MYKRKGQGNRFLLLGLLLVIVALFYVNINHIEKLFSSKPTYPGEMFSIPPGQKLETLFLEEGETVNIYSSDSYKIVPYNPEDKNNVISFDKFSYIRKINKGFLKIENINLDTLWVGIERKRKFRRLNDKFEIIVFTDEPTKLVTGVKVGGGYTITTKSGSGFLFHTSRFNKYAHQKDEEWQECRSGQIFNKKYQGYRYIKKLIPAAETFYVIPRKFTVKESDNMIEITVATAEQVQYDDNFKRGQQYEVRTRSGKNFECLTASYGWKKFASGQLFTKVKKGSVIIKKSIKEEEKFYIIPK